MVWCFPFVLNSKLNMGWHITDCNYLITEVAPRVTFRSISSDGLDTLSIAYRVSSHVY